MILTLLSIEILQFIVFEMGILSPRDVLSLALTCKEMRNSLLTDSFSKDLCRALTGFERCLKGGFVRPARLALERFCFSFSVVDFYWPTMWVHDFIELVKSSKDTFQVKALIRVSEKRGIFERISWNPDVWRMEKAIGDDNQVETLRLVQSMRTSPRFIGQFVRLCCKLNRTEILEQLLTKACDPALIVPVVAIEFLACVDFAIDHSNVKILELLFITHPPTCDSLYNSLERSLEEGKEVVAEFLLSFDPVRFGKEWEEVFLMSFSFCDTGAEIAEAVLLRKGCDWDLKTLKRVSKICIRRERPHLNAIVQSYLLPWEQSL